MRTSRIFQALSFLLSTIVLLWAPSAHAQDKAASILKRMDANGDGKLALDEWQGPPKGFKLIDTNGDGFLSHEELTSRFSDPNVPGNPSPGTTPFAKEAQMPDGKNGGGETVERPARHQGGAPSGQSDMAATLKRAKRDFDHIDENNDERISSSEWLRRGNFEQLDINRDGFLNFQEMSAMYRPKLRMGKPDLPIMPKTPPEIDPTYEADLVSKGSLSGNTLCAIDRELCKSSPAVSADKGLIPTGLGPRFPAGSDCFGIDDFYAMDYGHKRSGAASHGGFDIPAPFDTPVLVAAAGTVVGRFQGNDTQRGVEVIVRHSPEDTGLPFWTYTDYSHLAALPQQALGQRVQMGEVIGLTSNTGLDSQGGTSQHRRPGLHFVAWFSPVRQFVNTGGAIVPVDGQWMDPHTMYRGKPPFESKLAAALPDAEKWIDIPIMFGNGTTEPATTRMIWPYTCMKQR